MLTTEGGGPWDVLTTEGGGPWDVLTTEGGGPWDVLTTEGGSPWDVLTTEGGDPWDVLTTEDGGPWDVLTTEGGGPWDVLTTEGGVHGKWCCTSIKKQLVNNSTGLHIHTVIIIFTKQQSAPPLAMEATHGCASKFIGHSIRVTEGRGGGWLHGRYALTPWDTASELLKVEGEGGFIGGMH